MKVAIFGASGAIGKLLVALALEKGYLVNAYVRNPAKLDLVHPNLKLFQGELNDYLRIKEAVSGGGCSGKYVRTGSCPEL